MNLLPSFRMAQVNPVFCLLVACLVYSTSTFFLDSIVQEGELGRHKRSTGDTVVYPWEEFKPNRSEIGENCYINVTYDTVWPYECDYYLRQNKSYTIPCQPFCNTWIQDMAAALNLTTDCKYYDLNQQSYCNNSVVTQDNCDGCTPGTALYAGCCGTCITYC